MSVQLVVSDHQFAVIYELLYNIRLGGDNVYQKEITNLMIDLEKADIYNSVMDNLPDVKPNLGFTFSEDEGLAIELT